jgi:hypothetical protein
LIARVVIALPTAIQVYCYGFRAETSALVVIITRMLIERFSQNCISKKKTDGEREHSILLFLVTPVMDTS